MGLNDLVEGSSKDVSNSRRNVTGSRKEVTNSVVDDDFEIGDKEIKLRETFDPIPPKECNFCDDGISFPVKGLGPLGSKYRCYRIFCENSIMKHKREVPEEKLAEIRDEMEFAAKRGIQ